MGKHTFVDVALPLSGLLVCEWDDFVVVVSVGAVVVAAVPNGLVMWSVGNDSGTVCSVDLIVVDIISNLRKLCNHVCTDDFCVLWKSIILLLSFSLDALSNESDEHLSHRYTWKILVLARFKI